MPIYDYRCEKCAHEFEREQRITEPPVKRCPACKSQRAKRLISNTSFVLKGAGWYKDLYASPKPDKSEAPSGDAARASDTSAKAETGDASAKTGTSDASAKAGTSDASAKAETGAKEASTESKGAAKEKKQQPKAKKSAA